MKKYFLTPLFAPLATLFFLTIFAFLSIVIFNGDMSFFEDNHVCGISTYTFYGLALFTLIFCAKDFKDKKTEFFVFLFLLVAALFREMGIQHWLTKTDSTAFKLRFFTNPNNPISEKIISASILLVVSFCVLYLIFKYTPKIWRGFWHKETVYWTICSLCAMGILSKFADRLPGNYRKSTGEELDAGIALFVKIIEECGEAILPVLVIIALLQFHFIRKK